MHKYSFLFTLEWTICVHCFQCDSQGCTSLCKMEPGENIPPTFTSLWDCHPKTKHHFLAASHAGIALQGLPRLKAKDVIWCKKPLLHSFVALDNVYNLAISYKFHITKGQVSVACRHHAALNLSHIAHFQERSPQQSVMGTDLDIYYMRQWHQAE